MRKPVSRILVIEDAPLVLREIVKGLNSAARSLDDSCGIALVRCAPCVQVLKPAQERSLRRTG